MVSSYGTSESARERERARSSRSSSNEDDITAKAIGDFGPWQLRISLLMALLKLPMAWYQLNIIFMAPPQEFWCKKPESMSDFTDDEWRKMSFPHIEEQPCLIFDPAVLSNAPWMDRAMIPLVECHDFVYDDTVFKRTITSEWNFVCSKHWMVHIVWKRLTKLLTTLSLGIQTCLAIRDYGSQFASSDSFTIFTSEYYPISVAQHSEVRHVAYGRILLLQLTQCVMMWGVLLGGIIFGIIADKYGRRMPLIVAIVMQSLSSFLASVLPWYWWWLGVWFTLALASGGLGIISFVVCMEVVSGKWRTIIPVLYQLPFGFGSAIMASLAYFLRDWRKLEFALASLSALYILYCFWIPESPRWLLATGQTEKALEVLKNAALKNGRERDLKSMEHLFPKFKGQKRNDPGFLAFFKLKNMRLKTLLLSIDWFFTGLAFYAFSQYLGMIGGNIFLAVAISGIIYVPGSLICAIIVTKLGRKTTLWTFQLLTALCFVFIMATPKDVFTNDWPRLFFAGIGFAGLAGSVPALYLFSGELFPTIGRNVGVGGVTTFARIAAMVAPGVVSLDDILPDLPLMLLAGISFAQMLLIVPLPETKDYPLPDTLEQAEQFTRKNKQIK